MLNCIKYIGLMQVQYIRNNSYYIISKSSYQYFCSMFKNNQKHKIIYFLIRKEDLNKNCKHQLLYNLYKNQHNYYISYQHHYCSRRYHNLLNINQIQLNMYYYSMIDNFLHQVLNRFYINYCKINIIFKQNHHNNFQHRYLHKYPIMLKMYLLYIKCISQNFNLI